MYPCEIPSAISNQNATKSARSAPTFRSNVQDYPRDDESDILNKKYYLKQDDRVGVEPRDDKEFTENLKENDQRDSDFRTDFNREQQSRTDRGKNFVAQISTQTQTVKTVTLNKLHYDDEGAALEYIVNALASSSDVEVNTPKTNTVAFKKNKK